MRATALLACLVMLMTVEAQASALPLTVPITFENNQIYADVGINGAPAGRFILDTGASGCIVDETVASQMALAVHGEAQGTGAGTGTYTIKFVDNAVYSIGSERLSVPRSYVIDFSGQRTLLGRPIAGVLGFEFFQRYVVVIDVDAHTMTLSDPADAKPDGPSLAIKFEHHRPLISALLTLEGKRAIARDYLIDTGSGDAITDDAIAADPNRVEIVSGVGLGQEFRSTLGRARSFTIGPATLDRPIVGAGGVRLIGNEILRRFTITIDYAHARLSLVPNKHIAEPFLFDASGLDLRWTDDLENLVVHDVAQQSPASDAKITNGDIIAAINGRPAKSYSMEQVQALLRQEGTTLRLALHRAGTMFEADLRLRKRI